MRVISGRFAGFAIAVSIATCILGWPANSAEHGAVPDLSEGGAAWQNTHNDFILPPSGPGPVTWDPAHPYFGNGDGPRPTVRVPISPIRS
jgi:hypothetical protein